MKIMRHSILNVLFSGSFVLLEGKTLVYKVRNWRALHYKDNG